MTGTPAPSLRSELESGFDGLSGTDTPPGIQGDAPPPSNLDAPPDSPLIPTDVPAWEPPAMWKQPHRDLAGKFAANAEVQPLLKAWEEQWKEGQGYITKRDQEYADYRKRFDGIGSVIEPYSQYWAQQGLTPDQGVRQIFSYAEALANDPASTLMQLAGMYGVDLQSLVAEQPYVDPTVQALQREIAELRQAQQGYGQQEQQAQHNRLLQEIQAFQNATDEQGKPKAPYFDQVFDQMIGLARGGLAPNGIQQAYEMAVLLSPEIQAQLQQAKAQDEAAQKAAAAKRALGASQTVQSKSTTEGVPPSKSLRDELAEQLGAAGFT